MGPKALLPLWRKACWGFFRPKKSDGFGRVRTKASTLPLDHRSRCSVACRKDNPESNACHTFTDSLLAHTPQSVLTVVTLTSDIYGGQTSYQPVAALKSRPVTADDTTDKQTEKKISSSFFACFMKVIRILACHLYHTAFLSVLRPIYRGADKFLARPTSRCILFDGENISFDASLVLYIYINSTNIPPSMIINRRYETQNLLSL